MRLIVCGGRNYRDSARVADILGRIHKAQGLTSVIQGAADGADRLAAEWAWENKISVCSYPADWDKHGKAAGPMRNQEMVDDARADCVVAFPGGKGTADMVRRARKAGLTVWEIGS